MTISGLGSNLVLLSEGHEIINEFLLNRYIVAFGLAHLAHHDIPDDAFFDIDLG